MSTNAIFDTETAVSIAHNTNADTRGNEEASFLTLLQICDSIFPIGSYTQSNGLETYVQKGIVNNGESSLIYLKNMLEHSIKYGDGLAVRFTYDAVFNKDLALLVDIDSRLWASKSAKEIKEGNCKLCLRFLKLVQEFQQGDFLRRYGELIKSGECFGQYSIAFAIFAAEQGISQKLALSAFLYNQASGIVNNCAKLIPLGQVVGQKILFKMQDTINEVASSIRDLSVDDIGRCCLGFEIRSMQHEDLYSRLYMS